LKGARSSAPTDTQSTEPTPTAAEKSVAGPPLAEERPTLDVYRSTRGASLFVYQR